MRKPTGPKPNALAEILVEQRKETHGPDVIISPSTIESKHWMLYNCVLLSQLESLACDMDPKKSKHCLSIQHLWLIGAMDFVSTLDNWKNIFDGRIVGTNIETKQTCTRTHWGSIRIIRWFFLCLTPLKNRKKSLKMRIFPNEPNFIKIYYTTVWIFNKPKKIQKPKLHHWKI